MATPVYAVRADVVNAAGGEARLLQIADWDGDGVEDTGLVDGVLCEMEGFVNSFVRKVFDVPLQAPIPQTIVTITATLTVHELKARRDATTEIDDVHQEQRIKWLENLAAGRVDIGVSPPPTASSQNSTRALDRPSTKAVSRDNLKGFA